MKIRKNNKYFLLLPSTALLPIVYVTSCSQTSLKNNVEITSLKNDLDSCIEKSKSLFQ